MYEFDYVSPASLEDAAQALAANGEAQVLAGGQTLLPAMKLRLASPAALIDLRQISALGSVQLSGDKITIGAMATHSAVAESVDVQNAIPALAKLAESIGDPQVRNRGTIGGSIANNDPAADYPAGLLALGATIVTTRRSISSDDFFQGLFTTALEAGEIITAIECPLPEKFTYAKFAHPASRFALVGVAVAKTSAQTANEIRVAVTGAGQDGVFRWTEAEAALASDFSTSALASLSVNEAGLMSDIHADATYRAHLVKIMTGRALAKLK